MIKAIRIASIAAALFTGAVHADTVSYARFEDGHQEWHINDQLVSKDEALRYMQEVGGFEPRVMLQEVAAVDARMKLMQQLLEPLQPLN